MNVRDINANFGIITDERMHCRGSDLYRVVATRDMVLLDGSVVERGQLGGMLSDLASIVTDDVFWIGDECIIYGGEFHGGEFLGGSFHKGTFYGGIFDDGAFFGGEFHGGTYRGGTFNGGTFYDGDFAGGEFFIGDSVTKHPIFISGLICDVTITDAHMTIGAQRHSIVEWFGFCDAEIAELGADEPELWNEYKDILRKICVDTGRMPAC